MSARILVRGAMNAPRGKEPPSFVARRLYPAQARGGDDLPVEPAELAPTHDRWSPRRSARARRADPSSSVRKVSGAISRQFRWCMPWLPTPMPARWCAPIWSDARRSRLIDAARQHKEISRQPALGQCRKRKVMVRGITVIKADIDGGRVRQRQHRIKAPVETVRADPVAVLATFEAALRLPDAVKDNPPALVIHQYGLPLSRPGAR